MAGLLQASKWKVPPRIRHVRNAVLLDLPIGEDGEAEFPAHSLVYQIHYPTPVPPMAGLPVLHGVDRISKENETSQTIPGMLRVTLSSFGWVTHF